MTDLAREQMVQQQVRAWDVLDERVLDTFRKVPREMFVPVEHRYLAFADVDVPLPHGQHMLRPNVAGRLLQALELKADDSVLEIGAGSGFLTACLAQRSARVTSLEVFPDLAELARANLATLGTRNAQVMNTDAVQLEPPSGQPQGYDAIAVTASLPAYDERLQRLLNVGGRLFVVVGAPPIMEALLVRCVAAGSWVRESLFETVIDPMINARRAQEFTF
ncbi:MAG TPA: protein-L-isoaspartate O-methyltransferase [Steroidobacteraceae bacterium]|nr:protein-L-isoaspartate O-methyltransferase [Steroidobacteraceae bacterium]